MNAKDLIKKLEQVDPNDEVILWSYDGRKSVFEDLQLTTNPGLKKGFFLLAINHYNPLEELNEVDV